MLASISGSTFRSPANGPPGTARIKKNDTVNTIHSVSTIQNRRLTRKLITGKGRGDVSGSHSRGLAHFAAGTIAAMVDGAKCACPLSPPLRALGISQYRINSFGSGESRTVHIEPRGGVSP